MCLCAVALHPSTIRTSYSSLCHYMCTATHTHTCIHTHRHTGHTFIHTCMDTYVHTYIRTNAHTYIGTYIHTCIHTYLPRHIPADVHVYIHTHRKPWNEFASWQNIRPKTSDLLDHVIQALTCREGRVTRPTLIHQEQQAIIMEITIMAQRFYVFLSSGNRIIEICNPNTYYQPREMYGKQHGAKTEPTGVSKLAGVESLASRVSGK